eukprot:356188-Chlamydomonas_euryale.AAC.13
MHGHGAGHRLEHVCPNLSRQLRRNQWRHRARILGRGPHILPMHAHSRVWHMLACAPIQRPG